MVAGPGGHLQASRRVLRRRAVGEVVGQASIVTVPLAHAFACTTSLSAAATRERARLLTCPTLPRYR